MRPGISIARSTRGSSRAGLAATAMLLLVHATGASAAAGDKAGTGDHPLVGRYEGSVITTQVVKEYEETALPKAAYPRTGKVDEATLVQPVAGKLTATAYRGPGERSALEVVRNYEAALGEQGFTRVFGCRTKECGAEAKFWTLARGPVAVAATWGTTVYSLLSLERPAGRVWVAVLAVELAPNAARPLTSEYSVQVVEEKPIETGRVQVLDAGSLARAIESAGKVAVYGIRFDTDSDRLTADSAPQLGEIAALLKAQPRLSILVVGHTDTQGGLDYNRGLSERRATAVTAALVADHGIAKARLVPLGVGPAAPVASNRTADGRARNRRVEVVELKTE